MSGELENWLEKLAAKILPMIAPELSNRSERMVAANHFCLMAFITLGFDCIALAWWKSFAAFSLLSFAMIINAERPPIGRKVDWITRSAGWLVGAVPAVFILVG